MGSIVRFGGGRSAGRGYFSVSSRSGPGVLVVHDFFGLTRHVMDTCDRLNDEGFTALAPDLYDGYTATTEGAANQMVARLDPTLVMDRLADAAEHLSMNWHPRLGILGYSIGASLAARLAQRVHSEGTVLYCGAAAVDADRWRGVILAHLAAEDEAVPLKVADEMLGALETAGVEVERHVYPGAGHWFWRKEGPGYAPDAADAAWERTIAFFRYHLS